MTAALALAPTTTLTAAAERLTQAGHAASATAAQRVFDAYRRRRPPSTLARQDDDLALFGRFLAELGAPVAGLDAGATAWQGISWGLVEAFVTWQLQEGYAVGSINVRLSTIRTYAGLAAKAGVISPAELTLIKGVAGFRGVEGRNVDAQRETTRVGAKKAVPTSITPTQAAQLKQQPTDTPQGRRDGLLMCLLLDHGLRIGEVEDLQVTHIDLSRGTMTFYREKVHKTQTHTLTPNTAAAAAAYLASDAATSGPLLRGSRPGPTAELGSTGWGQRNMRMRVAQLGAAIGLLTLSPHDCRHYWATVATRAGTGVKALQDAGGWNSPIMPLRYAESSAVANAGVRLE
jgi:integrase